MCQHNRKQEELTLTPAIQNPYVFFLLLLFLNCESTKLDKHQIPDVLPFSIT